MLCYTLQKFITSPLQMICYTLQKVRYQTITFITNSLLPDYYRSELQYPLQMFCYGLQKFVTRQLRVIITFITNLLLPYYYRSPLHYTLQKFVTSPLHSSQSRYYRTITSHHYIRYK
jgi:hypothetical protein